MKSISQLNQWSFVVFALIVTMTPVSGQTKLTAKDVTSRLTSSPWKLATLWNTKDNNEKGEWQEAKMEETRYADRFGLLTIQFSGNGTFQGVHSNGDKIEGKWSFQEAKNKKHPLLFLLSYGDESAAFQFTKIEFSSLEFTGDTFVAYGDVCQDGCYLKVKFSKGQ